MTSAYEVLEVPKDADETAIRNAYRRLAKSAHPDLHPDDSDAHERFLAIQAAYEVLSDPQRRAAHDRDPEGVLNQELLERRKAQLKRRKARLKRLFQD